MKLIVNGIPFAGLETGITRYVRCLYQALGAELGVQVEYLNYQGLQPTMPQAADPNLWSRQTKRFWGLPQPLIAAINATQRLRLERLLRAGCRSVQPRIYHETDLIPPPRLPLPRVYTIHDLSLVNHRHLHPKERLWLFDLFFERRIRQVDHVITVSEFVRREIISDLGLPPQRVTAIHEAPSAGFFPRPAATVDALRRRMELPEDYILFVGTQEPRKNLPLLIRALALVKQPTALVLAGWSGWGDQAWRRLLEPLRLKQRVYTTGYVDQETLAGLYSGARVTVYPSLYEGFGLPVLEAMACGSPVIAARAASLPEVAGDAALLVDPQDPRELAAALQHLLTDPERRQELAEAGIKHAARFSWQRCARETLHVFERVAAQKQARRS